MSGLYFLYFRNIADTRAEKWKWLENRQIERTRDESIVVVVGYVRQNEMKMKHIRREFVTQRKGQ